MFFGGVILVTFAFQGLNITLLGSLKPTDMKNNPLMFKSFLVFFFFGGGGGGIQHIQINNV